MQPRSAVGAGYGVARADFIVPIGPGTIAGYVAHKGRTVLIDVIANTEARRSPGSPG